MSRSTTEDVGALSDLGIGDMKLARVGERRIAVIRSANGVHAIDNACPHQGYGLTTGTFDGEMVTCQWHNWKFRAADGRCIIGEEDVPCHAVEVADDRILVTVSEPTDEQQRAALWPSLRRGFDRDYTGQMARDTVRLLHANASPEDIIWTGIAASSPRIDWGVGHGTAMAADCLTMSDLYEGDGKALPLVQGLSGMAEDSRDREAWTLPEPDASIDLETAIEAEDVRGALAATLGLLRGGVGMDEMRRRLIGVTSQHHVGYGHGAIYLQKTFELLERVGWDRAEDLLPWQVLTPVLGTREDLLPYMRKASTAIAALDLEALAAAPDRSTTGWHDDGDRLRDAILDSPDAAIDAAAEAVLAGAGIEGLLDVVTLAVCERMLRYEPSVDFDVDNDFGWLDITHGITNARAARWAWHHHPSPESARIAMHSVFLAHDTGRAERWELHPVARFTAEPVAGDVEAAVLEGRPADAVRHALAGDPVEVGEALVRASLADRSTSMIVTAHVIKLTQACREEADFTGSSLPLAAAARYAAAPRLERFVARSVAEAQSFVRTGKPPKR